MPRQYLPSGLTKAEKRSPALRKRLSRCIRAVEKTACKGVRKVKGKLDYAKCRYNPVAVCRNSIYGKRRRKK